MAKPIPKKKNKKPNYKAELDRLDTLSQERMEWVNSLLSNNEPEFQETIIDSMVASLQHMQGPPRLVIDGTGHTANLSSEDFKLLCEIQDRNFHWIAMRCVAACAEWGIRLGNFKAPKKSCLRCGKKVKG